MAPVCVACRLSLPVLCVFLLFVLLLARDFDSLLVYDRQTLLDLRLSPEDVAFLQEIVSHLKPSGSPNNAVPPRWFREVFPTVGPSVIALINSSLSSGVVPENFKHAVVQPLIKKTALDPAVLANFRPISKLPFLSKILEKVVHSQLMAFREEHL